MRKKDKGEGKEEKSFKNEGTIVLREKGEREKEEMADKMKHAMVVVGKEMTMERVMLVYKERTVPELRHCNRGRPLHLPSTMNTYSKSRGDLHYRSENAHTLNVYILILNIHYIL